MRSEYRQHSFSLLSTNVANGERGTIDDNESLLTDMNRLRTWDHKLSEQTYLLTQKYAWVHSISRIVRVFSNVVALPTLLVLLLLYSNQQIAVPLAAMYLAFFVANEFLLKSMIKRQRPPWSPSGGYAFPSSHSVATGLYVVLVLTLPSPWNYVLLPFFIIIPASRVFLGLHYWSDIIGGLLIGMSLSALLVWQLI